MAGRIRVRPPRREGPSPFTSAWNQVPAEPAPVIVRTTLELPAWWPNERTVSAFLVLVLTLTIALFAAGRGDHALLGAESELRPNAAPEQAVAIVVPSATQIVQGAAPATATAAPTGIAEPTAAFAALPAIGAAGNEQYDPLTDGLLPQYRILTFYGHPHDPNMGIVGEHAVEEVHRMLLEEAARYEIADPTRKVLPAFEVIATVAQREPQADGTYILNTDIKTLTEWVNYAADHDLLVFLDIQIGRGTVAAEIEKVRSLLLRPNVHLAIDPEFAVAEGQIPGLHIGSVWAESITYAQQELAAIVEANNLPPKIVIVHQFREDMIKAKETLRPVPGVQLVIDADGFGDPDLKTSVYNILVRDEPVEFGGIKLFYKQDKPLMEPAEVIELNPSPDVIIIQ